MDIYTPPTSRSIQDSPRTILMGVQGKPASGKTAAALTFPNPLVLHFDKSDIKGLLELPHLKHLEKINEVPFWDESFICDTLKTKRTKNGNLVDRRTAFNDWLRAENSKFTSNQTLILDSWSSMQDSFDTITFHESEKVYSQGGVENFYKPWENKIAYSLECIELLKSMKCNVVVLFHEHQERDKKTGELLDKVQPLMQGKFMTELKRHFPYFVRQFCRQPELVNKEGKGTGLPDPNARPEYVWQIVSNEAFDCKFIGKPERPRFIKATYEELMKL